MTATGRNRTYRYYTCFTRNRYGTDHCNAPRIEAEAFDDIVLAAVGDFYRTRTDLITQAITAAQHDYRATKAAVEAELITVTSQMAQKEAAVDRYFTDYEAGTIDKALLEARIEKLGVELRALRRHRDELHLRINDEPQHLTGVDLTALNAYIGEVIDHGTAAVRKSLCEAAIHELRIDLNASRATPVFRVNLAVAGDAPNDESAPAGNPAGAHIRSSHGVRERTPRVEPRGLEHRSDGGEDGQVDLDDEADPFGRLVRRLATLASEHASLASTNDILDGTEHVVAPDERTDDDRDPMGNLITRAAAVFGRRPADGRSAPQ